MATVTRAQSFFFHGFLLEWSKENFSLKGALCMGEFLMELGSFLLSEVLYALGEKAASWPCSGGWPSFSTPWAPR